MIKTNRLKINYSLKNWAIAGAIAMQVLHANTFAAKKKLPFIVGNFKATVEEQGELFSISWNFKNDSTFIFDANAKKNPKNANKNMRGKWTLQGNNLIVSGSEGLVNGKWQSIPDDGFPVLSFTDTAIVIDMHEKLITLIKQK